MISMAGLPSAAVSLGPTLRPDILATHFGSTVMDCSGSDNPTYAHFAHWSKQPPVSVYFAPSIPSPLLASVRGGMAAWESEEHPAGTLAYQVFSSAADIKVSFAPWAMYSPILHPTGPILTTFTSLAGKWCSTLRSLGNPTSPWTARSGPVQMHRRASLIRARTNSVMRLSGWQTYTPVVPLASQCTAIIMVARIPLDRETGWGSRTPFGTIMDPGAAGPPVATPTVPRPRKASLDQGSLGSFHIWERTFDIRTDERIVAAMLAVVPQRPLDPDACRCFPGSQQFVSNVRGFRDSMFRKSGHSVGSR